MDLEIRKRKKIHVTKEEIKNGLRKVGLNAGDVAFVHSSLSSFGYVEGGANAVIDALLETVGEEGTIVIPTFTPSFEGEKDNAVFDVRNTPSEIGLIPEVFRQRKEAIRSHQVLHSVAAIGRHAQDVMGDCVTCWGKGSTFHQLYKLDNWILLFGVGFTSCTMLHVLEEYMKVPYRQKRYFDHVKVILSDGTEMQSKSVAFLRKPGYYNDFAKMDAIFTEEGVINRCRIGESTVTNIKARDIFHITKKRMEKDIFFLLKK